MRKAKIVCTLGPATDVPGGVEELVKAGMNVARLNMSHGNYADHLARLHQVREAAAKFGRPIGTFADLQGPKIRLATFADGPQQLVSGDTFTITTRDVPGDKTICGTTLSTLTQDVRPGDQILVNDGAIELRAVQVTDTGVVTEVVVGGKVSDHKGINLPGVAVSVPALSEKDAEDLRWALRHGVDMIALSFVRSPDDILRVHEIMDAENRRVPVIAKIEKPQAMEHLHEIVHAFDAIMVARGDLGVELPLEDVPGAQKQIITEARRWAKPVIVATQMLESMITAPRPTRAEASDVANAILDGADAVMLSGETAVGAYPTVAVETMSRIVNKTETLGVDRIARLTWNPHTTGGIIAKAAVDVAEGVGAKYLVAFTKSGDTALRLCRLRSAVQVLAFSPEPRTVQEMTLAWGVKGWTTGNFTSIDAMVQHVSDTLRTEQLEVDGQSVPMVEKGDKFVIVTGNPKQGIGKTNSLRVVEVL